MRLNAVLWRNFSKVGKTTKEYSNLPDSYIKRAMEKVYYKTPKDHRFLRREDKKRHFYFGLDRPWTEGFQHANRYNKRTPLVEPIKDWSFFRGDRVEVLSGKDKGKQGIVVQLIEERNWVIVEGLNCRYRNVGKTPTYPGALVKEEMPLLVTSEVALVDPSDTQPTEIEWRYTEEGVRVRVSKRTGRIIPMPKMAGETHDYKTRTTYKENEKKDTKSREVMEVTFEPCLKTFEMDIMDKMGIKETHTPCKTYWY